MTKYLIPEELLKGLGVCIVALIIWFPLKTYGEGSLLFNSYGINWVACLLGLNSVFIVNDFVNFKEKTEIRHYILGALLCPIWIIARFFVFDSK